LESGGDDRIAIALGPIAGGALITHFWYGSIFLVNVPLALLAMVAIALVVPESRGVWHGRFDVTGLMIGTIGLTALVVAIIQGPSWGWHSYAIDSLFVVGPRSSRGYAPRTSHSRTTHGRANLRQGEYAAGSGAIATNFFCLFGFIFLVTQYFQLVRGYSPLSAGVHTLPFAVVVMITTPLSAVAALRMVRVTWCRPDFSSPRSPWVGSDTQCERALRWAGTRVHGDLGVRILAGQCTVDRRHDGDPVTLAGRWWPRGQRDHA